MVDRKARDVHNEDVGKGLSHPLQFHGDFDNDKNHQDVELIDHNFVYNTEEGPSITEIIERNVIVHSHENTASIVDEELNTNIQPLRNELRQLSASELLKSTLANKLSNTYFNTDRLQTLTEIDN